MATTLNKSAFEHARRLVRDGKFTTDERDDWSEHQPSAADENAYLDKHGYEEYGLWYLGVDDEQNPETKSHYKFPYGDFAKVHRCGVISAESRAGQNDYDDIESAALKLRELIDEQ
ncbi:hypothetical protein SAMN05421678_101506 [Actinopolymorpha cephalotaxi]|uniref:Uncharacterized protein n=1 Tax=Actinopolymorpha cephalotaxi TaxID=504797 RepID=A0A1I2KUK2_9ACTN|nr:hypothetical protein [Actinopolymorpha cephalotaxi]NYH84649.1 hypothetical protein [Actinopolymorpha cephalotaxi]SFF70018.1 hypothetical protein SAMN05421678_101506 [Actinopolymorpha cephalotaxi]